MELEDRVEALEKKLAALDANRKHLLGTMLAIRNTLVATLVTISTEQEEALHRIMAIADAMTQNQMDAMEADEPIESSAREELATIYATLSGLPDFRPGDALDGQDGHLTP